MSDDTATSFLRDHPDGCSLAIRVQPGAKRTAIAGIHGEGADSRLKIALQAPPIEGRANEALVDFLAEIFSVARSAVIVAYGQTGRSKLVVLRGIALNVARSRIQSLL
ncbi:DUF167 domain-containing protein [Acidicapsa acidisoli]|uniref:DUF167 domain-containing protein n=1 Tax=Acidicapsa acidisoli TaxID=1615681 RepID=UPI0021DFA73F|nr:DUF167 domain-containing protein [Acidicapsa acidisoli]